MFLLIYGIRPEDDHLWTKRFGVLTVFNLHEKLDYVYLDADVTSHSNT
jgi:hypothetical protein